MDYFREKQEKGGNLLITTRKVLYHPEMAEGIEDAVLIDGSGDVVGLLFQRINGITHRNANACLQNHGGVVASVAKGDGVIGVKTFMTSHCLDALALVGPIGCNVGKLRMPTARDTLGHTSQQLGLVVGREEGRQLENILLQDFIQRRGLVEVLDSQHLPEYAVHIAFWVEHSYLLTAYDYQAVAFLLGIVHTSHNVLHGDGLTTNQVVAHIAQGSVGGDIAVYEVFDSTQVSEDNRRTARSNIDPRAIGLGLCERKDGGSRNLVGLETDKCSVDIEKQSVFLCLFLFHGAKVANNSELTKYRLVMQE